jgi:CRP/FNR family cyclic AMP-dependent transcriptional regulator
MDAQRAIELLRQTQLFGDLDVAALEHLAERATKRTYSKGQLVFHQGDPAGSLFVRVEGLVKVCVTSEDGDEMVLVTLQPHDVFGELSLLDGGPRSASAQAVEATSLLELQRGPFLETLHQTPGITESLMLSMGRVLRRLTEQASDLVFLDLHGRVAKLLVNLAQDRGIETENGLELDLQLTQTDLAGLVGGSRQSVNQILRSFENRGYVDMMGRKMVVKQPELLRRRAGL